jgi:hypothetical protein
LQRTLKYASLFTIRAPCLRSFYKAVFIIIIWNIFNLIQLVKKEKDYGNY